MRRSLPPLAALLLGLALLAGGPVAAQSGTVRLYLPLLANPITLTASYLGTAAADSVSAADFAPAGGLLLAGAWPDLQAPGVTPTALLGGGPGALIRLDAAGRQIGAITRLPTAVADMEASPAAVVVCGDFGVAALRPDLGGLLWSAQPGAVKRCAIGADGTVAALVGKTILRYGPTGGVPTRWAVAGDGVADLAVDAAHDLVFATGYTQKGANLKVAFLRAFSRSGGLVWSNYDHAADLINAQRLTADSEGRRVALGRDGKLYFAGWTDGGNAIYGRDPRDLARQLGAGELIKTDNYSDPYNISGAKSLAWYGRFDPASGLLERGQWLLTRLSDGKGNSIGIKAIAADADGRVLLAGDSSYALKGRVGMQFAGATLGAYEGSEPYLLIVSPDLRTRQLWTALAAPGTSAGSSPLSAAAIKDGLVLVGGTLSPRSSGTARGLITTGAPLQPAPGGAGEGYFLLMPTP